MKVPKIIHYCWFGPNPIPELELKCIASWNLSFPNYKFMFWNEKTFNISDNSFAREAYENKHYAFVSDYVRTKVLFDFGGIYLDTDVEVLRSFDKLIKKEVSFIGFETHSQLGTAVMAFSKGHEIMKIFLNSYINNNFISKNGDLNRIANVTILTDVLSKKGLRLDGSFQEIKDVNVYPREYFYPKKKSDYEFEISSQTISVHKCSNSWMTEKQKKRGKNKIWIKIMRPSLKFFKKSALLIIGPESIKKIEIKIRNILD